MGVYKVDRVVFAGFRFPLPPIQLNSKWSLNVLPDNDFSRLRVEQKPFKVKVSEHAINIL